MVGRRRGEDVEEIGERGGEVVERCGEWLVEDVRKMWRERWGKL